MEQKKNTDKIHFAKEVSEKVQTNKDKACQIPINGQQLWKILIIDDEKETHYITEKALSNFTFKGKGLLLFHAYSGEEAKKIIGQNPDTAIVLLDVVLETEDAGLKFIQYIRQNLRNSITQIVIRTGQPGHAPEQRIIEEYEINDYRLKTELTAQKIYTLITTSLRSYQIKSRLKNELKKRTEIERSLRKSENRFKDIATAMGDWIWEIDTDLRYTYISQNIEMLTGYSQDELKGNNFFALMSKQSKTNVLETITEKISRSEPFTNIEIWKQKKDDTKACFLVSGKPIWDKNHILIGYRGVNKDITDLKRAEKEKEMLIAQLRQAQRMEAIGTLAGGIAHDFNNILGAILGYTQLLQMDFKEDTKEMHYAKKILGGCERAKNLILQILDFSRHNKKSKLAIPVSPSTITKEALKLLRSSIPSSIRIETEILDNAGYILADPTQLHNIIMNLFTNAYQAIENRQGVITIKIDQLHIDEKSGFSPSPDPKLEAGDYITLSVADDGRGINPEIIEKIFEPYFTTKKGGDGTGLGLAVVHGIVDQYNGKITVTSVQGKGAEFIVYFPKYIKKETILKNAGATETKGKKILFVDDEDTLVELGKSMLTKLGCHVVALNSGIEALKMVQDTPFDFDLVITDMTMPDIQGCQLALKIKAIRQDLPVILSTGFSNIADSETASPRGIDAVLAKPFSMSSLAHAIDTSSMILT